MSNIFLFLALLYILSLALGRLIERIRIPWIFAALFLGFFASIHNPFEQVVSSKAFDHLAQVGMYFLLFLIGYELDLEKMKKSSGFILKGTFVIISLEAVMGTMVVHFAFGYGWFVSFVVSLSFATVGEAVLIPILDEFNMVNTRLGQSIIGIGVLDDLIEVFVLILTVLLISSGGDSTYNAGVSLLSLLLVMLLTAGLFRFGTIGNRLGRLKGEVVFLFAILVLFLFVGLGGYGHSEPIGALLAGAGVRALLPPKTAEALESKIKAVCYGYFGPVFFFWVGSSMNFQYLLAYPFLVLLIVLVSKGAKLLGSVLVGRKELGLKRSIVLGIGLSIRFSTSVVIIKILYDHGIVGMELYSAIIASTMAFKFIVPLLFAQLLTRWNVDD
jgi:Ca2+-transporting ATPase